MRKLCVILSEIRNCFVFVCVTLNKTTNKTEIASCCRLLAHGYNKQYAIIISPLAVCDLNQIIDVLVCIPRIVVPFVIICVLCAIKHLHGRSIAHRDVKDPNILIMEDGTPVLVRRLLC